MADKFDIELLISLVKTRSMLWDKSLESHKDLGLRAATWREICKALCPQYETLSKKDKHLYVKSVIKKWTNIRDAWRKSVIETKTKKKMKPYLYHKHLRFLEKNLHNVKESLDLDEEDSKTSGVENEDGEKQEKVEKLERIHKYLSVDSDDSSDAHYTAIADLRDSSTGRKRRVEEIPETESTIQVVDVNNLRSHMEESPHICFIRSLLPTLNKLNDDEVLDFQGGVIQLLQRIRKRGVLSETIPNYGLPSSSIDVNPIKVFNEEI
ncbi:uncharacterized protein LOC123873977 [Maniola jurtina]|uniref:uncharacterized protein LOC123873977 n=1 Tax=Maniola jurtina TaxID=191418 RepID=UPI001E6877B8|nr:uncharacterized protein LOC123873977 [Maniola jurtina]XP_045775056.1 uncharacterized protein LOC123873977 [Maniola jurtina]XP_045775057.1 uncharacterized protein LOC123873977 [Maniola jurtina]XP_045775058.1 uncharacterized protein LOC123873977 [Maniola jurtina]XP_045775059.1 uncharacterized protein LOC123873977 [Maniola jurtina]